MEKNTQPTTTFSSMSDAKLREMFHQSRWKTLDETKRLDLLQEVVNREVVKNGGQYVCKVEFCNLPSNTAGEQRGNTICLNRQMFVQDMLTEKYNGNKITYDISDSNYNAYETVLHEHQHVKQDLIAAGALSSDEEAKAAFQANGFTTTDVDGKAGSQYLLGVTDYSLYYLNPTELDAYKTSQAATRQLVAAHQKEYGTDSASEHYLRYLSKNGFDARLAQYREMYQNEQIDKDVQNALINHYFHDNRPVNPNIEKLVTMEMIESQNLIEAYNQKELSIMAKQTFTENGFTFVVDEETGTTTAKGKVTENPASRNGMKSIQPTGYNSQVDDKGHLIAARQGGPAKAYNVSAQNRALNRGSYKTVENAEVRLANKGNTVETEKTAYISNPGAKPDAYMVNDTVTTPDGKVQHIHASFQNESPETQQEWNDVAEQYSDLNASDNPDAARESMSQEEYNALLEEANNELLSVRDEFDVDSFAETSFSPAASEINDAATEAAGMDSSIDNNADGGADNGCDDGIDME